MFSLFGVLRVFAKISLVSLCDLPAVRPLGHKQASESTADSRKLPGFAVLFSGFEVPMSEES
jgi:hypothetical protein